ncbi:serine hydrolase [Kribbella sp. ALI-6-A]|uniref:serine hydrolase domain-containing protein n=1 Tax=Kribbella sp. ALI-6-A TaxID=1933817 RepID=UPI00097CA9BD|nr:serine hydrolase domain-containing protein [Kribbella sp. ALI-6-A]ONI78246.1 serine hydrolase [Kribbella sp. ALI-6-A]
MAAHRNLLPRTTPAAAGVSSRAIVKLLDELAAEGVECHSLMIVRRGQVVAEGWWAPYSADRPHLVYSLTKSFSSVAVGLAVADGLLSLDDRVVDVLPDHLPADLPDQARRLTVQHLLTMTAGHATDSLAGAWELEPGDLIKGFLRGPFEYAEGTRHTYDNSTTFVLARMVERVTGRGLPELLDERLFHPMGIHTVEWDRVASGAAFGFHGLHLTTEAVAAFGELLLRGGRWGDRRLVPREWLELATRRHIETLPLPNWRPNPDFLWGYGYQFWMSRHGFHGHGAYGQYCVVVPSHDVVIAMTASNEQESALPGLLWDCVLPGLDHPDSAQDDEVLAERLRQLSFKPVKGSADRHGRVTAKIGADSALPDGTAVSLDPVDGGWLLRLGTSIELPVGHGQWRESSPLGRPMVAAGGWQGERFIAELFVITSPHRVRLVIAAGEATARWNTEPLTTQNLELHLRAPLMTRPDVS